MPKTVLLADDSLTIQRVVTLTFANEDVTITSVSDGDQAVEAITRSRPDLVLADIAMPGRTGYQVVQFVRSQPELASLPVLLLAGAFDPVDEAQARMVGADGVLTKPFDPSVLIGQVNLLLATGRPQPTRSVASTPTPRPVGELVPHPTASNVPVEVAPAMDIVAVEAPAPVDVPEPVVAMDDEATHSAPAPVEVVELVTPVAEPLAVLADPVHILTEPVPVAEPFPVWVERAPHVEPGPVAPVAEPVVEPHFEPHFEPPFESTTPVAPVVTPMFQRSSSPDSYFDQIDQAFAALAKAPRPMLNLVPKPSVDEPRDEVVAAVAEAAVSPAVSASPKDAEPPVRTVLLCDAFNALLDAERAGLVDTSVRLAGVPAVSPVDIDALATQVARRVLEQMSDRVIRETVSEIVSNTAERMVREEIEQVKRHIT